MPMFSRKANGKWRRGQPSAASLAKRVKPTAENQKTQIIKLGRQISSLEKYRKQDTEWTQYKVPYATLISEDVNVWHVTDPSTWYKAFGPAPSGVARLTRFQADIQVRVNNEPTGVTYSCFLFSLKKATAGQLMQNLNMSLAGLIQDVHYVKGGPAGSLVPNGQCYLNPMFFQVHKEWRFQLAVDQYDNAASPGRNPLAGVKRFTIDHRMNKALVNGRGDFDPSAQTAFGNEAQLYFAIFNDNSGLDGQVPACNATGICTVRST